MKKFDILCQTEQFTKEEIADKSYMIDKVEIWLDNDFITEVEALEIEEMLFPTLFTSDSSIEIKDPNLSECLRFEVDPKTYYGTPYLNYLNEEAK